MEIKDSVEFREEYARQQEIIDYTPGGMHVCCLTGYVHSQYCSDGLCKMLGYTREEFDKKTNEFYENHLPKEDWPKFDKFIAEMADAPNTGTIEYRMLKKNGDIIYVSDTMESSMGDDGIVRGYSSVTDITKIKEAENELIEEKEKYKQLYQKIKISQERFRMISLFSGVMFYEYDLKAKKYLSFENTKRVLGYADDELIEYISKLEKETDNIPTPGGISVLAHPDDRDVIEKTYNQLLETGQAEIELRFRCSDGNYRWFCVMCRVLDDNDEKKALQIGCIRNVDSVRREIENLRQKVSTDSMTGVLNKVSALKLVDDILKENFHSTHAFIFVDMDNFKIINDRLGHDIGDKAICFTANLLKSLFRERDIVARFGGDEFFVFIEDIDSREAILERISKFNKIASECDFLKGTGVTLSASIGVVFSKQSSSAQDLCMRADQEAYKVKNSGKASISVAKS